MERITLPMSLNNLIVKDCMIGLESSPVVKSQQILKEEIHQMEIHKLGIVNVIDENNKLIGVITDGDLRRTILREQKPLAALLVDDVDKYTKKNPLSIFDKELLINSINLMNDNKIWDLPVIDEQNNLVGLLHLHTALKKYLNLK